jgi:hypothetical protein
MVNPHWRIILSAAFLGPGALGLLTSLVMVFLVSAHFPGVSALDVAYWSCLAVGLLTAGNIIRLGSTRRWLGLLAWLAFLASAAVAFAQSTVFRSNTMFQAGLCLIFAVSYRILPSILAERQRTR